jgi:hypothetical protein
MDGKDRYRKQRANGVAVMFQGLFSRLSEINSIINLLILPLIYFGWRLFERNTAMKMAPEACRSVRGQL